MEGNGRRYVWSEMDGVCFSGPNPSRILWAIMAYDVPVSTDRLRCEVVAVFSQAKVEPTTD